MFTTKIYASHFLDKLPVIYLDFGQLHLSQD